VPMWGGRGGSIGCRDQARAGRVGDSVSEGVGGGCLGSCANKENFLRGGKGWYYSSTINSYIANNSRCLSSQAEQQCIHPYTRHLSPEYTYFNLITDPRELDRDFGTRGDSSM